MTSEQRAQLVEDIRRSANIRERIVEHAMSDHRFDIVAAWKELDVLDKSINDRVIKDRKR